MAYGMEFFDSGGDKVLGIGDRTGQIATTTTATAQGGASYTSITTTTVNLPTSFDSAGITSDSEVVIFSTSKRTRAYLVQNAGSPKWSVKLVRRGTGTESVTIAVVHFGDT
jgi:hypothetical protein